ncbi:MAG: NUDIX hydrolase [Deltaproteobacteria bacterium]|nr:MAG: NUDIX hydrolase [Deltaproteobacteria bacterium]
MSLRPAATVLVLRDGSTGPEVFMVQRHRKSGFMPSAWVFPGGRVDEADGLHGHPRVRGGGAAIEAMDLSIERATAFLVAALRETFEEAGVFLGDGALPQDVRQALQAGDVSLIELLEAHDATIDLDRLSPWSWWITPEQEPRRYDTRFLLARAVEGPARHDEHETVDSAWIRPGEAVLQADASAFPLAPPTWWTLKELAAFDSVDAIFAEAPKRPRRPIQPILHMGPDGLQLVLPGHPDHPDPPIEGLPSRIGFDQGRWWTGG